MTKTTSHSDVLVSLELTAADCHDLLESLTDHERTCDQLGFEGTATRMRVLKRKIAGMLQIGS